MCVCVCDSGWDQLVDAYELSNELQIPQMERKFLTR
jgi:hypothetical protein